LEVGGGLWKASQEILKSGGKKEAAAPPKKKAFCPEGGKR